MMTSQQEKYIEFGIGEEHYAVKIEDVYEIIRMQSITDIPFSRRYIKGVINLRGKVVPVIALRVLIGLPDEAYTKSTRIVVVKHLKESVGIIVDSVNKVTSYSDIQPAPEQVGNVNGSYFRGIGVRGKELVGILKLDEVLLHE